MGLDNVKFFGEADRKDKRKDERITSPFPSWYFDRNVDELAESVRSKERELELDLIAGEAKLRLKADLAKEKERLALIRKGEPKLSAKEKDELKGLYDDMGEQIKDSMFTRTEMKKGLADAHEELRRMKTPVIKIDPKFQKVAQNMGCNVEKGKISRDDASRIYKIAGKFLGENTNTEALRRDYKTGTHRLEKTLEEMIGEER